MKLKDIFFGAKLGLSIKKKFKLKFKTMQMLFKLWALINAPSTSAKWKLNHVDFVKSIFKALLVSGGYVILTSIKGNTSIDWNNVLDVSSTALVALLGSSASTNNGSK